MVYCYFLKVNLISLVFLKIMSTRDFPVSLAVKIDFHNDFILHKLVLIQETEQVNIFL